MGLEALNGSVIATGGDVLRADGNQGKLLIEARHIDVSGSTLEAGRQVLLDAFTNAQGSVVAVNSDIDQTQPNGEGATLMLAPTPTNGGGVGVVSTASTTSRSTVPPSVPRTSSKSRRDATPSGRDSTRSRATTMGSTATSPSAAA